jgi:Thiopurine S-methyltransferase (TPMT).
LGWHLSSPHHFLLRYGSYLVPNLVSPPPLNAGDEQSTKTDQESSLTTGTCNASSSSAENAADPVNIFVPLCGKTVDMAFLATHPGVKEVVGVDGIREALVEFAQEHSDLGIQQVDSIPAFEKYKGKNISLLKGNFFDLEKLQQVQQVAGPFDGILDRASMVAIDPSLRESYVNILGKLLKPGGCILLITFDRRAGTPEGRNAGPPFSVDDEEVRRLYGKLDWVESITKLDEKDELDNDESKKRWLSQGVESLFELVYVIQAKK